MPKLRIIRTFLRINISLSFILSSDAVDRIYTLEAALKQYAYLQLSLPQAEVDGRIQTLNKKGAMAPEFDRATKEFLQFVQGKKALEFGGSYGNVMLQAFKENPETIFHLNDLDERHLFIAAQRLADEMSQNPTPRNFSNNVRFLQGDIAEWPFTEKDFYDGCIGTRVLHFLNPKQLEKAMAYIFGLLKSKGRFYTLAISPYNKRYKNFIPEYEQRLRNGDEFPGYVDSLIKYVDSATTTQAQQATIHEGSFMFLGDVVMRRVCEKAGFRVIVCETVPLSYVSAVWSLDGRENVIVIAEKP